MKPKRSRGQNFLVDQNMLKKIVVAAHIAPTDTVVEIGAGTGNLTGHLAARAKRVIAIEIDQDLIPVLIKRFCHPERHARHSEANAEESHVSKQSRDPSRSFGMTCGNVEIIHDDACVFDPSTYGLGDKDYAVVANIPYNITSLLIRRFLEADPPPTRMVLLVQKEVAERICAQPPHMSILSVAVQYYADPRILFSVPRTCFSPRPRVDSALVSFRMKMGSGTDSLWETEPDPIFLVVRAGFAHKRKFLQSNLADVFTVPRDQLAQIFQQNALSPTVRAQELSVAQWKELASALFPFSKE